MVLSVGDSLSGSTFSLSVRLHDILAWGKEHFNFSKVAPKILIFVTNILNVKLTGPKKSIFTLSQRHMTDEENKLRGFNQIFSLFLNKDDVCTNLDFGV